MLLPDAALPTASLTFQSRMALILTFLFIVHVPMTSLVSRAGPSIFILLNRYHLRLISALRPLLDIIVILAMFMTLIRIFWANRYSEVIDYLLVSGDVNAKAKSIRANLGISSFDHDR